MPHKNAELHFSESKHLNMENKGTKLIKMHKHFISMEFALLEKKNLRHLFYVKQIRKLNTPIIIFIIKFWIIIYQKLKF
jgi:hypothetical protein